MEKKLKVAELATLLGVVPKTIYKMIERKELITVNERVNNRRITLVVTSDEQINNLKLIYSKEQVNYGNYYDNVTDNNQSFTEIECSEQGKINHNVEITAEVIDRIITLNDGYNEQLREYHDRFQKVNEELITAKSKMLLLEDKAGREGFYINEINGLKKDNDRLRILLYWLITVIVILFIGLTGYITYNVAVNNTQNPKIEINQPPVNDEISEKVIFQKKNYFHP